MITLKRMIFRKEKWLIVTEKLRKALHGLFIPVQSARKMTITVCLGMLCGLLPLPGIRLPIMILLCILFNMNILAMFCGLGAVYSAYAIPFVLVRYFAFDPSKVLMLMPNEVLYFNIAVAIILPLICYPFVRAFLGKSKSIDSNAPETGHVQIFADKSGFRSFFYKRMFLLFIPEVLIVLFVFTVSLQQIPQIKQLQLPVIHNRLAVNPIASKLNEARIRNELKRLARMNPSVHIDYSRETSKLRTKPATDFDSYGFYVNWDENSYRSLQEHIQQLDAVIAEWYFLKSDGSFTNQTDPKVVKLAKFNHKEIYPMLSNFSNGKFDPTFLHAVLSDAQRRGKLIAALKTAVLKSGGAGINLDLEQLDTKDAKNMELFIKELAAAFHPAGLKVQMEANAQNNVVDLRHVAKYIDNFVVMLYDEHYATSTPGPVASQAWVEYSLKQLHIPKNKVIGSLGAYGYDWTVGNGPNQPADSVTFGDILSMLSDSNVRISWDKLSGNPYYQYETDGDKHQVWFLDAATFYNQSMLLKRGGYGGTAIWRLGAEDPGVFDVIKHAQDGKPMDDISSIKSPDPVRFVGDGEILKIDTTRRNGSRDLQYGSSGFISNERYLVLPQPYIVTRYGQPKHREIALTFDDGPDPQYTPQVLDILAKEKINATFFVIGENAERNPGVVRRIVDSGNEIGNHTFTHPNIAEVDAQRTDLEINATQRLIGELTGRYTLLFRPPYLADAEPSTYSELVPVIRAQRMGYIMVGEKIDPNDWAHPPADVIVKRVMQQLPLGHVILLHDAGGDRTATVKALPEIIQRLKAKGYTFVTVSQILGVSRNSIMPKIGTNENFYMSYDRLVFGSMFGWHTALGWIFYSAIVIGILRLLFLLVLAFIQRRKYHLNDSVMTQHPSVCVVIAAYNEEMVIAKTVESILATGYPGLRVCVVDDGSVDATASIVESRFVGKDNVTLVRKKNGGKASAINTAVAMASEEIIVCVDADTKINSDAIDLMVRHFEDERIVAVSGNVRVGNVKNLITLWQHVEYVTGFNLERRAFDVLNCITVVPGAIGAWRRSAITEAGNFTSDTLAEDTDLTMKLLERGGNILYEENAIAYTESPETTSSLLKQRFRWSFGTLQCLWKHKHSFLNAKRPALGFIAMPNMFLFQYFYQIVSPLADIIFVLALFEGYEVRALLFYCFFIVLDYVVAILAFRFEHMPLWPLAFLWLQRVLYRLLMWYVVVKSIISAFRGMLMSWNKLDRTGSVK